MSLPLLQVQLYLRRDYLRIGHPQIHWCIIICPFQSYHLMPFVGVCLIFRHTQIVYCDKAGYTSHTSMSISLSPITSNNPNHNSFCVISNEIQISMAKVRSKPPLPRPIGSHDTQSPFNRHSILQDLMQSHEIPMKSR